jgi:Mn-dependent DtxR family transcriptional regulator
MEGLMVKEIKPIKGVKEREQYRKDIVRMLAETNEPTPLDDLPGLMRDIKDLENQELLSITSDKMASLTEKGKSYVVYGKK